MNPPKHPLSGWIGSALLVLLALILIPLGLRAGLNPAATPVAEPAAQPAAGEPTATPAPAAPTQANPEASPSQAAAPIENPPPPVETILPAEPEASPAPGLWIYYGETTTPTQTTIWKARPGQASTMEARQAVATIEHQEGYPPRGSVSPDGSWLALQVVPLGASERAARSDGTEIWLISLDQQPPAEPQRVLTRAGFLAQWAPDSRSLVFGRRVALENPADPQVPFLTELVGYDLAKDQSVTLYANQTAYSIQPLGWAGSTGRFYVSEVDLTGQWSVVLKDPQDTSFEQRTALPARPPAGQAYRSISLAPGGSQLLLEQATGDVVSLTLLSIETGQETPVVTGKAGGQPYGPFTALWAADGQSLLVHRLGSGSQPAGLDRYEPSSQAISPMALPAPEGSTLIPLSLSPDLAWIVLRDYTQADLPILLQHIPGGESLPLPRQQAGNALTFFGWQVR